MFIDPLVRYYLHQAGRGKTTAQDSSTRLRSSFSGATEPAVFLSGVWRAVRSILWSGAKILGRATLRTGGDILKDFARSTDENPSDIVSRRVNENAQNLMGKLLRGVRKRKGVVKKEKALKNRGLHKEISSPKGHQPDYRCQIRLCLSVPSSLFLPLGPYRHLSSILPK